MEKHDRIAYAISDKAYSIRKRTETLVPKILSLAFEIVGDVVRLTLSHPAGTRTDRVCLGPSVLSYTIIVL